MRIFKFGGTSVATPERVLEVREIVRRARGGGPVAVVVSAFGGVTTELLRAAEAAARREESYLEALEAFRTRHREAAERLAAAGEREALLALVEERSAELHDLLHGVYLLRELSARARDSIASYGERLSAELVATAFRAGGLAARAVDSRPLLLTDATFGRAQVDLEASYPRVRRALAEADSVAVVTGFIGATAEGQVTTLGRGGSDYTAALLGAAVGAEAIEIWTDVDGVMSADPREVAAARVLPRLSYAELMELSHFGAKVIYPPSVHPARSEGIPLWIKNTLDPAAEGTLVEEEAPPGEHPIRGISSIRQVALLRLEGDGMVGVPGIAGRLFGALARRGVSVILISQSSSEHSICFAVAPEEAPAARRAVEEEFVLEREVGLVEELVVEEDQSVVAVVGEAMRDRPGIAARIFDALGNEGVSVRAIAQGSSELNVSLVVAGADEPAALATMHRAFFGPRAERVELAVAGVGRVGRALLEQLRQAAPRLLQREGLDLRLVALGDSLGWRLDREGLDLTAALAGSEERERVSAGAAFEEIRRPGAPRVFVDLTASDGPPARYPELVAAGVGVVAANKRFFAGDGAAVRSLLERAAAAGVPLGFEATAGAGLPVVRTLRDLGRSGDRIRRLEGVLSGTLNAVLDLLAEGRLFSEAVREAHARGLTEPHPFDDLSGLDVARKLVILARLAGFESELGVVEVEPLLPAAEWGEMDLDTFWLRLAEHDTGFEEKRRRAAADGLRLRYVGSVGPEGAAVRLLAVSAEHPAHALAGPDNLVAITSERYDTTPLVVRGPGAGPAVTAAGVFADILEAASRRRGGIV